MTSAISMLEAEHTKPVPWTTQRGRVGREVGQGFRMGGTHVYLLLIHVDV